VKFGEGKNQLAIKKKYTTLKWPKTRRQMTSRLMKKEEGGGKKNKGTRTNKEGRRHQKSGDKHDVRNQENFLGWSNSRRIPNARLVGETRGGKKDQGGGQTMSHQETTDTALRNSIRWQDVEPNIVFRDSRQNTPPFFGVIGTPEKKKIKERGGGVKVAWTGKSKWSV